MLFNTLSYIGEKFNSEGILWAIGASVLLNQYGLVDNPNDIDILVDIKDIEKADIILKQLGKKKEKEAAEFYSTEYFYEYIVNGIDIDVMAGFIINYSDDKYIYTFDDKSVTTVKSINGVDIPLTSLEDWYIIYQLIPGREEKVKSIESYLLKEGIKNENLIKRALMKNLPDVIRKRVSELELLCLGRLKENSNSF